MLADIKNKKSLTFYQTTPDRTTSRMAGSSINPAVTADVVARVGKNVYLFDQEYGSLLKDLNLERADLASKVTKGLGQDISYRGARGDGVSLAWKYEKADVQMGGKGSADWNKAEQKEILDKGRVRGAEGHHQKNVSAHLKDQADPDNIRFYKTREDHLQKGHQGKWDNETDAPFIDKNKMLQDTNQRRVVRQEVEGEKHHEIACHHLPVLRVPQSLTLIYFIPDPKTGGGILTIGMCYGMSDLTAVVDSIKPGDTLTLDNSDYIALQSYYRHQVPDDLSFRAWDQFRDENGRPTLPQRKNVMGYSFSGTGTVQDGQIQGKVIVVQAMMDEGTCPWCADWYRKKVIEATGSEKDFRVYYMEQCLHGDVAMLENNIIVNYLGAHKQALLDLSDWVERGIEPPASSEYRYEDGQIYLEEDATKRRGVQSIVKLTASATGSHAATANGNHAAAATGSHAATANGNHTAAATGSHAATANGSDCVTVKVGEKVTFTAKAVVPHGVGTVTAMDFGFEDIRMIPADDCFPVSGQITHEDYNGQDKATATVTHTFTAPGTYFASVRVKSERSGNEKSMFTQVKNLARARVVVK